MLEASTARPELLSYIVSATSTPVLYTNEFAVTSQNPVMCPVLYSYTKVSSNHGQSEEAIKTFAVSTSAFTVKTTNLALLIANSKSQETYSIYGHSDAYSRVMPFKISFEGCQDAYLVAVKKFKITATLP